MTTKRCTKCGETKSPDDFYKNAAAPDGLQTQCKVCHSTRGKAHYKENKAAKLAAGKLWYEANKKQHKALVYAWRAKYPELTRAIDRKSQSRPERLAKQVARNRGLDAAFSALTGLDQQRVVAFYRAAKKLSQETGQPHEVDHRLAVALGGQHHPDNLQILTRFANRSKGAKQPEHRSLN